MIIINGENQVLGRLGTVIAKKALLGEEIHVLNCEKIILSGSKDYLVTKYKRLFDMGTPRKGPFFSKEPTRFVKRIIRGMLPHKQEKGREALERIKFYKGIPKAFADKEFVAMEPKRLRTNYMSVNEILTKIGGAQ